MNTDHTTIGPGLEDRYEEFEVPGAVASRYRFLQWHVGDCASLHLNIDEPWTLVEARISVVISREIYRAVITKFDGKLQTLGGFSIGDEFPISHEYFYAIWAPGYTRADGEGRQKIHQEGSLRRDFPFLKSKPADDILYNHARELMDLVDCDSSSESDAHSNLVRKLFSIQRHGLITDDEFKSMLARLYSEELL